MTNPLLCLLAVFSIASAHCPYHNHHHQEYAHTKNYHNKLFDEISNDVIALDKKIQNLCTQNSNGRTQETISSEKYELIIPLDNFNETEIEVKVKNRVLYVNMNKQQVKRYSEIRVLPSFVDTKKGRYSLIEGKLYITFDIKTDATEECPVIVDSDVITINKAFLFGTERIL